MTWRRLILIGLAIALGGGAAIAATPFGRTVMFHVLPIAWTGEAARLAAALQLGPGAVVADLGAGNGALIVELARFVGPQGRAYASERTPDQRQGIAARAADAGVSVTVIEAGERVTNLPDGCCDAVTMRMVLHHVADRAALARDIRRSLRPGGQVAIVDFAPGALPHLADDHGVNPGDVLAPFAAAGFEVAARDDAWGGGNFLLVFRAR